MVKNETRPIPIPVQRALRRLGEDIVTWRKLQRLTAAQVADRAGLKHNIARKYYF
jgi:hypothetical protein